VSTGASTLLDAGYGVQKSPSGSAMIRRRSVVMAASATDNQIGVRLLDRVVAHTSTVSKAWVDAGFKDDVAIHGALMGIDVEQVKRSDTKAGFVPIAKRWVVEQVNGT
jgi:hypothetical protein